MRHLLISMLLLIACSLYGCARDSAMGRAEQSCLKYPTPSARAECEGQAKADNAAFLKESQKKEDDAKARAVAEIPNLDGPDAETKNVVKKKSGLCFKRESTGEMVCPN